jgi:dihydrodipicolinate synthase/N-acetylneuraminate lyase
VRLQGVYTELVTPLMGFLFDLHGAVTQDPSPAAVKWALSRLGYCGPEVRLPITPWPQQDEGLDGILTTMNVA